MVPCKHRLLRKRLHGAKESKLREKKKGMEVEEGIKKKQLGRWSMMQKQDFVIFFFAAYGNVIALDVFTFSESKYFGDCVVQLEWNAPAVATKDPYQLAGQNPSKSNTAILILSRWALSVSKGNNISWYRTVVLDT